MKNNAYGLSRSRDEKGHIVDRPINDYVNCIHTMVGGGHENMWVLVIYAEEDLKKQRNELGRKMRKAYEAHLTTLRRKDIKELVPMFDDLARTITTVTHDNLLLEINE